VLIFAAPRLYKEIKTGGRGGFRQSFLEDAIPAAPPFGRPHASGSTTSPHTAFSPEKSEIAHIPDAYPYY
jgi:hypothetical protein